MPDWETVRLFLEVVRAGSLRSGACRLGLPVTVLRRRIDQLEHELGVLLFTRHVSGVRLTPEGEKILSTAKQMESVAFDLLRAKEATSTTVSGEVRIAVTEGTGTFWLAPRLAELQQAHPKLLINLKCLMTPADVSNLEADVSVQLEKPTSLDLKVVRLGRLHTMPFAAKRYVDLFGVPKKIEDLRAHRLVLHVSEQTRAKEMFEKYVPDAPWVGVVSTQTNVASAHLWAVSKGSGIGWLPTYAHLIGGRIVPLDLELRFFFDIWLTYHPDAARITRVRRVIDWIKDSFDARRFPWFGDDFIHPYDLPKAYMGEPLVNLFEGFVHHHKRDDDASANVA